MKLSVTSSITRIKGSYTPVYKLLACRQDAYHKLQHLLNQIALYQATHEPTIGYTLNLTEVWSRWVEKSDNQELKVFQVKFVLPDELKLSVQDLQNMIKR